MGLFDRRKAMVSLTPLGKIKVENQELAGKRAQIANDIADSGSGNCDDIAHRLGWDVDEVKLNVRSMIADGYCTAS